MSSAEITKRVMADAMKSLMLQKPLAKISVGDIVDVCGINRNSFYYHFRDKYDLVNWIFYTEITRDLNHHDTMGGPFWPLVEDLCDFFYKDRLFYENALSVTGQNSFLEYFLDLLKTLMKTRMENVLEAGELEEEEDREFIATFFADAFVTAIFRWLTTGAKTPPGKLAAQIKLAAIGPARQLLEIPGPGCICGQGD